MKKEVFLIAISASIALGANNQKFRLDKRKRSL